jgi:hypothetical protein
MIPRFILILWGLVFMRGRYCGVMELWQTCPLVSGVGITG